MKDKDLAHGILTATIAALAEDEELVVKTQEEWWIPDYGSCLSNTQYHTTKSTVRRRKYKEGE